MFKGGFVLPAASLTILAVMLAGCGGQQGSGAPPLDGASGTPTVVVGFVECPPVAAPATSGPGFFTGDDGFDTLQKSQLGIDQGGCSSTVTNIDIAENWIFQGTTGQNIEVWAEAYGDADPQVTLFDPNGDDIDVDDNSAGENNALLRDELPLDGVYTLRVVMFVGGTYTITVQTDKNPSN